MEQLKKIGFITVAITLMFFIACGKGGGYSKPPDFSPKDRITTQNVAGMKVYTTVGAQDYTFDAGSRVADPDTSTQMGFSDIPRLHDGRIWTDKSVSVGPGTDDFTVTLSALSQSFPVTDGYVVPADTVFIIDVSGSMYQYSINGRTRIAVLVDALNEAISILLEANPRNRVAVVAYGGLTGGYSRAENILPLDRPVLMEGASDFFSYGFTSETNHFVDVHTTNRSVASVLVQGSTPTQRGILLGANILAAAGDLTIPALNTTGEPIFENDGVTPLMITRKPNFILMTDGEPTLAWEDYLFENIIPTNTNQTYGDGSFGETGVSLLTVLTAAHRKRLVYNHYFSENVDHKEGVANYDGKETVGFYTISLNDVPPPLLIAAAMFPFAPGNTGRSGNADAATPALNQGDLGKPYPTGAPMNSMGELLRRFVSPAPQPISFYAQRRGAMPTWWIGLDWEGMSISNPKNLTLEELAFADQFFPADDLETLRNAFISVTTDIQRQSFETVTDAPPGREHFDGYLVFSDVLGEYMEFGGVTELEFDGASFDRENFGPAIIGNIDGAREKFEDILFNQMNYDNMPGPGHDPTRFASESQIAALIKSNIDSLNVAQNNSIKYYANSNRDYVDSFFNTSGTRADPPAEADAVVELFPMWGAVSNAPVIDGSQTTDLMYIAFHLVTSLENNTILGEIFETNSAGDPLKRTMNRGDQLIRWYIPASLIPQRKVDPDTGVVTGNQLPIRVRYTVELDRARVDDGITPEYKAANQAPDKESVYFYTNRNPEDITLAFYEPHVDNPYYHPGRPGDSEIVVIKTANPTGTAPHVTLNNQTTNEGSIMDLHWLGNNGRLMITFDAPPDPLGSLTLIKTFEGLPVDGMDIFNFVSPISFLVVGTDAAGNEIYRKTVAFEPGAFVWKPAPLNRYEFTLTDLPLGNYRVYESGGYVNGFIFNRPEPPALVSVTTGGYASVSFVNRYNPSTPPELPALTIRKAFHGLTEAEKPVGFQIRITGPGGFNQILDINAVEDGRTFANLALGEYKIEEINSTVPGFDLSQVTINGQPVTMPHTFTIATATADITIIIYNFYTPTPPPPPPPPPPLGSLTISKVFMGLPEGANVFNYVSNITFLVLGTDAAGNEIYRKIVAFEPGVFVWEQNRYELTLTNLPLGNYRVYESGGHADGFVLNRPGPPEIVSITVAGGHASVHFVNRYDPVTPPKLPALTIRKVFHGLANPEKPADFQIRITGPGGFNQILNINAAENGCTFANLALGEYKIEEINSTVPGFNLSQVTINNWPATLPYIFTIADGDANIAITIDNSYTQEPLGSLTITKAFMGLPGNNIFNLISPISFLIVGTDADGNEIYRNTVVFEPGVFIWKPAPLNRYEFTLTDLPLGDYRVYENGGNVNGFVLNRPGPPEIVTITVAGGHVSVHFVNSYDPVPPPVDPPPVDPPPVDPPTNPPTFWPPPIWPPPIWPPTEPPPVSPPPATPPPSTPPPSTPPPATPPKIVWPPTEPPPVWPPTEPPTEPPPVWPPIEPPPVIPPPSTPPPGPQTGDDRRTAPYIIMLVAGIGFMGSAIRYGRREEKSYQGKRLSKRR